MKNGVDPHAFAAEHQAADPIERRRLTGLYATWIKRGAEAQGWQGGVGISLVGLALLVIVLWALEGSGSPQLYAVCGFVGVGGVLLTRAAWRREQEWRRSNPFNDWRRSN